MTQEQIKALIEDAENQVLLAKDSVNAGDWDKVAVRIGKVMQHAAEIELKAKVLEGRKRSQAAEDKLNEGKQA